MYESSPLDFTLTITILQSKKNYERACREAEVATKAVHSAEMDVKSTKAQLDKVLLKFLPVSLYYIVKCKLV